MAFLVDTNVLVYRFDDRYPAKQKIATELLRKGVADNSMRVPHQAIMEFLAVMTRPVQGHRMLPQEDAFREAEEMLHQFPILYPNEAILREAMRASVAYRIHWLDAQMWAYAEHYGLSELYSEDLQHDRLYGSVRVVNPFLESRHA